jgi:hypothetical protein
MLKATVEGVIGSETLVGGSVYGWSMAWLGGSG